MAFAESLPAENLRWVASRKSVWSMDFSQKENWPKFFHEIAEKNPLTWCILPGADLLVHLLQSSGRIMNGLSESPMNSQPI